MIVVFTCHRRLSQAGESVVPANDSRLRLATGSEIGPPRFVPGEFQFWETVLIATVAVFFVVSTIANIATNRTTESWARRQLATRVSRLRIAAWIQARPNWFIFWDLQPGEGVLVTRLAVFVIVSTIARFVSVCCSWKSGAGRQCPTRISASTNFRDRVAARLVHIGLGLGVVSAIAPTLVVVALIQSTER